MPVNKDALFEAAVMVAEIEEMQLTMKYTLAASTATAIAGIGGFLVLGPAGFIVGPTLAGLGAYGYTRNKFKPVFKILKEELRPQQQQQLISLLKDAFKDLDAGDVMKIITILMNNRELCQIMQQVVRTFLLEHYLTKISAKHVDVQVKSITDVEVYQRYVEDHMKQNQLTGGVYPPAVGGSTKDLQRQPPVEEGPGWRLGVAGVSNDANDSYPFEPPANAAPSDEAELPSNPKVALTATIS